MKKDEFKQHLIEAIDSQPNRYHPLVWISKEFPDIGKNCYIGGFTEIYSKDGAVVIWDDCDIASFVVINCADSHLETIGKSSVVEILPILIQNNVFIGTMSAILGGTTIGHHSVIGAGVVLKNRDIPPYSLVYRDDSGALIIKEGYYRHDN